VKNKGKEEIFAEEALVHSVVIYRVALRMIRNREDAEELVQETFLQAWKSFDKYEPGTNCRAWLCQILFNKVLSLRRRFAKSKYLHDADEFTLLNVAATDIISEHLTDATIIAAIDKLPDYFRSVILLTDVYDFKYKEVTKILQIPTGTVMSRLSRARTELRKTLAGFAAENGRIQPRTESFTQNANAF